MSSNQRARLVLNPLTLVAILLVSGLVIGAGWIYFRDDESVEGRSAATGKTAGSDIELSSTEFDFGKVTPDRTVVRQLLLRNHGSTTAQVRIDGAERILVEPRKLDVEGGKIGRVFLTARPGDPGAWEEEIRVVREDTKSDPLVVRLRGSTKSVAQGSVAESEVGAASEGTGIADLDAGNSYVDGGETGGETRTDLAPGSSPSANPGTVAGSVQITRSTAEPGSAGSTAGAESSTAAGTAQLPSGYARVARDMAERPTIPTGSAPLEGEEAAPLPRRGTSELEENEPEEAEPTPGISVFVVSSSSTLNLLGTANQFYPQQLPVLGTAAGGSFTLNGSLQFPRIPLAFGQSMQFSQRGPAVGSFDPGSGQVVLNVAVDAVDSNGRSAPFVVQLTTGSVVTRNASGVLVSVTGESRSGGTGLMRLVGIGKIPEGYRNGAEMQLVTFEILATLQFASPSSDSTAAGGAGQ